jgi:hypothetical protein
VTAVQTVNDLNKGKFETENARIEKNNNSADAGLIGSTNDDRDKSPQDKKQQIPQQKQPVAVKTTEVDWDKKIIKTATVNLEVSDYQKFYLSVRDKVKSMGGYIAQEEQSQSDYKIENTMSIKVPVDQFDNAMVSLTGNVTKINERKISSQDVTTEVIDIRSRMEAKKQMRQRYMGLLAQAKNMEEILNVQSEINQVQEEIESATSRVEYLTHSSSYSVINLTYYQVLKAGATEPDPAKEPSFGEKLTTGLATGWSIVSNFFIVLITIWPLLLGSLFAYLLYKKWSSHKPKQA